MFLPAVSSTGGGTDAFRESPPQPVNKRTESNVDNSIALAHAISASGNALKIFTYAGNPLAINLPQWLFFAKRVFEKY
jgi:hypothetical protein